MNPNTLRCSRYQRTVRAKKAKLWNATVQSGEIVGHLCPTCQTPEENAEAEINEATTTYGRDAFGRYIGRPKVA